MRASSTSTPALASRSWIRASGARRPRRCGRAATCAVRRARRTDSWWRGCAAPPRSGRARSCCSRRPRTAPRRCDDAPHHRRRSIGLPSRSLTLRWELSKLRMRCDTFRVVMSGGTSEAGVLDGAPVAAEQLQHPRLVRVDDLQAHEDEQRQQHAGDGEDDAGGRRRRWTLGTNSQTDAAMPARPTMRTPAGHRWRPVPES